MKNTIIFFSLIFITVFAETEVNLKKQWLEFKTNYGKNYTSEEEAKRYKIFKENLQEIEQHNSNYVKKKTSYKKTMNKFGDLTKEEFAKQVFIDLDVGALVRSGKLAIIPYDNYRYEIFNPRKSKTATLPPKIDWRDSGVVGRVKNQLNCGSCWAFAAIGAIESQLAIKQGNITYLSEQNLVDCSRNYENLGCYGGTCHSAFEYAMDKGVASENDYPTIGSEGSCQNSTAVTKIKGYYALPQHSEASLQYAVGSKGPVTVTIHATAKLQFYSDGVFEDESCSSNYVNHALLVVGYGTNKRGKQYWILKNSWGPDWGHNGYLKLARNAGDMCGVALQCAFPYL